MASIVGVGHLVKKDFMAKNDLKPWWEELRSYANAVTVGSSLFMTWVTSELEQVTVCLPYVNNGTMESFSSEQSNLISTYCDVQLDWYLVYPGLAALGAVLLLYFVANIWTVIPKVVDSVKKFKKAANAFDPERTEESNQYLNDMDKNDKRSCCCSVKGIYIARNVLVLLGTAAVSILGGFVFKLLYFDGNYLECSIPQGDGREKLIGALGGQDKFICSYKNAQRLLPPTALFTLGSASEFVSIAIGTAWMVAKLFCVNNEVRAKCRYFMITLWENSHPDKCKGFAQFVKKITRTPGHDTSANQRRQGRVQSGGYVHGSSQQHEENVV